MNLTLAVNIGLRDAEAFKLARTLEGESVDVPADVADVLLKRGWAVPATVQAVPDPPKVKAVPPPAKNGNG